MRNRLTLIYPVSEMLFIQKSLRTRTSVLSLSSFWHCSITIKLTASSNSLMPNCHCCGIEFDLYVCLQQRWVESKKLTPNPYPKTKNSNPAPKPVSLQIRLRVHLYHAFTHMNLTFYTIPYILNPGPVFPKILIRIRIRET